MFYFKDSENPNIETETGPTGSFIKYVEKHSCYKAAEKLLLALAEKNKECAGHYQRTEIIRQFFGWGIYDWKCVHKSNLI